MRLKNYKRLKHENYSSSILNFLIKKARKLPKDWLEIILFLPILTRHDHNYYGAKITILFLTVVQKIIKTDAMDFLSSTKEPADRLDRVEQYCGSWIP